MCNCIWGETRLYTCRKQENIDMNNKCGFSYSQVKVRTLVDRDTLLAKALARIGCARVLSTSVRCVCDLCLDTLRIVGVGEHAFVACCTHGRSSITFSSTFAPWTDCSSATDTV